MIRHGLTFDEYTASRGISITRLKEMRRSPLHYRHAISNSRDTAPMSLGRAAHCAVLEPDLFETDFVAWTRRVESGNQAPRNGKHWDAFKLEHAGREIITEDQMTQAVGMRDAVRASTAAMRYLREGSPEVSIYWETLGMLSRGRIDWVTRDDGHRNPDDAGRTVLVGLKSAEDCRMHQFGRQAARLAYHLQWAYYHDGWQAITGESPRMVEIVVEPKAPHAVAVVNVRDEDLQIGREEYMGLFEQLAECERTGVWHGPNDEEQDLIMPAWVYGDEIGEIKYVEE